MLFMIKMHWKSFLLQKCIRNDFYYKNAFGITFTIKCIENDFYHKIIDMILVYNVFSF